MDDLDSHLRVRRITTAAAYTAAILILVYLLLNCSGMNFPIRRPGADLSEMLSNGYGVSLPASATVDRGGRQATFRNTYYFAVRMNPADVRPFVASLQAGGWRTGRQPVERDPRAMQPREPSPPGWWAPAELTKPVWLDLMPTGRGSGLWVFYSEQDGRVLLWWYSM